MNIKKPQNVKFFTVKSTRVKEIAYDINKSIVYVIFPDGTVWEYKEVPNSIWQKFYNSTSKGFYLNKVLQKYYKNNKYE